MGSSESAPASTAPAPAVSTSAPAALPVEPVAAVKPAVIAAPTPTPAPVVKAAAPIPTPAPAVVAVPTPATAPIAPTPVSTAAVDTATSDELALKNAQRAARFGIPVVEPKPIVVGKPAKTATTAGPKSATKATFTPEEQAAREAEAKALEEKLLLRAQRFGVTSQKTSTIIEVCDEKKIHVKLYLSIKLLVINGIFLLILIFLYYYRSQRKMPERNDFCWMKSKYKLVLFSILEMNNSWINLSSSYF